LRLGAGQLPRSVTFNAGSAIAGIASGVVGAAGAGTMPLGATDGPLPGVAACG
jgi:hypothetical protein